MHVTLWAPFQVYCGHFEDHEAEGGLGRRGPPCESRGWVRPGCPWKSSAFDLMRFSDLRNSTWGLKQLRQFIGSQNLKFKGGVGFSGTECLEGPHVWGAVDRNLSPPPAISFLSASILAFCQQSFSCGKDGCWQLPKLHLPHSHRWTHVVAGPLPKQSQWPWECQGGWDYVDDLGQLEPPPEAKSWFDPRLISITKPLYQRGCVVCISVCMCDVFCVHRCVCDISVWACVWGVCCVGDVCI